MAEGVKFITEAGSPSIPDADARALRDELLAEHGLLQSRAHSAAHAIEGALLSDREVELGHAERLAVLEILERRPQPLEPEWIAFAAALRQAPSLTHEFGRDS